MIVSALLNIFGIYFESIIYWSMEKMTYCLNSTIMLLNLWCLTVMSLYITSIIIKMMWTSSRYIRNYFPCIITHFPPQSDPEIWSELEVIFVYYRPPTPYNAKIACSFPNIFFICICCYLVSYNFFIVSCIFKFQ